MAIKQQDILNFVTMLDFVQEKLTELQDTVDELIAIAEEFVPDEDTE